MTRIGSIWSRIWTSIWTGLGWASLLVLCAYAVVLGGADAVAAGSWLGSLAALCGLLLLVWPMGATWALPAAGLATLLGGIGFSALPKMDGLAPLWGLLAGVGAAVLVVTWLFRRPVGIGRWGRMGAALLAGACHAGLLHLISVPPMVSPFFLWPWAALVVPVVWLVCAVLLRR